LVANTTKRAIADLEQRRESLAHVIASATAAKRKLRQMRGANAHKRVWYYEEQIEKASTRMSEVEAEIQRLSRGDKRG
jgi:hypothetical protein